MPNYKDDKTFFESITISKENEAKQFIEDYGVDGEKLYRDGLSYQYVRKNGRYNTKDLLRVFCKDCTNVNKCKGDLWDTCKYRMYLLTSINKELVRENKELREIIEKYKMEEVKRQQ